MQQNETQENTQESVPNTAESNGLILNGEAWKDKNTTTYTSILDLYGVPDLFSGENTALYEKRREEDSRMQEKLQNYLFSGELQQTGNEAELTDYLFSGEIELSKVKSYTSEKESYMLSLVLAAILICMIFGMVLTGYSRRRKKRRESFAAEINMEDFRTE